MRTTQNFDSGFEASDDDYGNCAMTEEAYEELKELGARMTCLKISNLNVKIRFGQDKNVCTIRGARIVMLEVSFIDFYDKSKTIDVGLPYFILPD